MKLCGVFLVLALAGTIQAASITKPVEPAVAFTAELDDGFHATVAKSAINVNDEKENSVNVEAQVHVPQNAVKSSPTVAVNEETHIPVKIVHESEKVATKTVDLKTEDTEGDKQIEVKTVEHITEVKPSKFDEIVEEKVIVDKVKSEPDVLVPVKLPVVQEPVKGEQDEKVPEVQNKPDDEECEAEKKKQEDKKNEVVQDIGNLKSVFVNVDEKEQVKQSEGSKPETPSEPATPGVVQQGLLNLSQGIQNISNSVASIVRPNPDGTFVQNVQQGVQNVQQGVQNLLSRNTTTANVTTTTQPFITQFFSNITTSVQNTIGNITASITGFFSNTILGTFLGTGSSNGTTTTNSTNILQQGINNWENFIAGTINAFNNTITQMFNGTQQGFANINQVFTNLTSAIFPRPSADEPSASGVIQETAQRLSQRLQQGVKNINETLQSFVDRTQTTENNGENTGIIRQSISNIHDGIQRLLKKPGGDAEITAVREKVNEQIKTLNQILHEGISEIRKEAEKAVSNKDKKQEVKSVEVVEVKEVKPENPTKEV